ncbi:tyrosine-type recombinase/integrase [Nonomuraea angiospora]|nr:tyrosine-type recombinase/integrase [Nonomuraea angiospora]
MVAKEGKLSSVTGCQVLRLGIQAAGTRAALAWAGSSEPGPAIYALIPPIEGGSEGSLPNARDNLRSAVWGSSTGSSPCTYGVPIEKEGTPRPASHAARSNCPSSRRRRSANTTPAKPCSSSRPARLGKITKRGGLGTAWSPRELRHSFVSIMSDQGVPIETIADLAGHAGTSVTETVYRRQLRPMITKGAHTPSSGTRPSGDADYHPHS